jgi:hypothetical protein
MHTSPGYRIALDHLSIDCNRVAPHLYQGSAPPQGHALARAGFDVVVFCARALIPSQPPSDYPGVEALYCPLTDVGTRMAQGDPDRDWARAVAMAWDLASRILRGERILVTCHEGWNRSGLVCALILHFLTGESGLVCAKHVHLARPWALGQPVFVNALCALGA